MSVAQAVQQSRSVHERRTALVIGPDCKYPDYSLGERAAWRKFFLGQEKLFPGRAADEYLAGLQELQFTSEVIPSFATVSAILAQKTGWRIAATTEVLRHHELFACFADRIFPCTDRLPESLNPGVTKGFRSLLGQVPLLTNPHYADFLHDLGRSGSNCRDFAMELSLIRIYHAAACRGLLLGPGGLRVFGGDLLTSRTAMASCLGSRTRKWPFRPSVAAEPTFGENQNILFVLHSLAELQREFALWARKHQLI